MTRAISEPMSRPMCWLLMLRLVTHELSGWRLFDYPNLLSNEILRKVTGRPQARFMELVTIDETEYDDFEIGHSPLSASRFRSAICIVLAQNPAVLVVDFIT